MKISTPFILCSTLAAALIAGCHVGPKYTRPEALAPAAYQGADGASTPADKTESIGDLQWNSVFPQPELQGLIREALAPYPRIVVATKAGLTRTGPNQWTPLGRPEYLIQQAHASRLRLGVEIIDLWQLHRIDPKVPRDEQFAAIKSLIDDKVIRHAGLSEVFVEEIETAAKVFPVATVQNRYNLGDRASEAVLDYCEANGIGFIPWYPLAAGELSRPGGALDRIARAHKATAGQIALAWLLQRSPVILPIPGTSKVAHLDENAGAADIELSEAEFEELNAAVK